MGKKLVALSIVAAASLGGLAYVSAAPYAMAGCGLGSVIIGADGFVQVFAATTNGSTGTQTFGITTGTSNCVRSGVVLADKEQEAFFESNFSDLKGEIAQGSGEHLEALAELFSCKENARPLVYERAQKSYETVFPNVSTTPMQALYMLKVELSKDAEIAAGCIL
jgi:hypothetical protein